MTPRLCPHLHRRSSFISILRAQDFTYSVSQSFLTSSTFHLVNPRSHYVNVDTVFVRLPASAVSGLTDEVILSSLTKGFFGGWVFAIEAFVMRTVGGILPGTFTGLKDKPTKKIIWKRSDISRSTLPPVGDMFFDFVLVSKHIQSKSDPSPSHVDYGFGSDRKHFAGSHRFRVTHEEGVCDTEVDKGTGLSVNSSSEGSVELSLECIVCDPTTNRYPLVIYLPWIHYWYARFLWANAVKTLLRR